MLTNFEEIGGIAVLQVMSHRMTAAALPQLAKAHAQMVQQRHSAMVVDLSKVRRITDAGLGALLEFASLFHPNQTLALSAANPSVADRIHGCRATRMIPYFDTIETTIASAAFQKCRLKGHPALILCAGKGTRMAPLSEELPKPMVDVFGQPVLSHLLQHLGTFGIEDILLNPGHLGHQIIQHLPRPPHQRLHFFNETAQRNEGWVAEPLGSASTLAKLHHMHHAFENDTIVMCGDALTNLDLAAMMQAHRASAAEVTIAAVTVPRKDCGKYGIMHCDPTGRVLAFQEKPHPEEALSTLASTGIYIISPKALTGIPMLQGQDIAQHLLPAIMARGGHIHCFAPAFEWADLGSLHDYAQVHFAALRNRLNDLSLLGKEHQPGLWLGTGAKLSRRAKLSGPCYIGADSEVGAGVELRGPCVIGKNCKLDGKSLISDSIILAGTHVKSGAWIDGQITHAHWSLSHTQVSTVQSTKESAPIDRVAKYRPDATRKRLPHITEASA